LASPEHKSGLEQRVPAQIDVGVSAGELRYLLEELSQHGSIGSAKRQRHSVVQFYKHIATGRQIELVYVVEVNDCIAMNAQKTAWVKDGLKVLHTLPKQVRLFPDVESNVLPQ
jgi:hypothetical protein